jgi:hypothetical protein
VPPVDARQRHGPPFEVDAPALAVDRLRWRFGRGADVDHQLDQLVLAADIAVERHRGVAEPFRDAVHRDGGEPFGVGELHRRAHDRLDAHAGLRPAPRRFAQIPQQVEARGKRLVVSHIRTVYNIN